jgi:glycosyltransferase involved in cell wall biosynthesis
VSASAGPRRAPRLFLVNFEVRRDSRALAWQRQVLCALAARCEQVIVLTEAGDATGLPENVEFHRVPFLLQKAPLRWFGARSLMLPLCARWIRRARIDVCFVHMNMPWAWRLGPTLRATGVPLLLWYAHGAVSDELRRAEQWADAIVTSSPEGFRLPSKKVTVIGQGIDTGLFSPGEVSGPRAGIVTVGRLSGRKRLDRIIDAFGALVRAGAHAGTRLTFIGAPLTRADASYELQLRRQVDAAGLAPRVDFAGHVSLENLPAYYRAAALHVNLSDTGSMDKTVLESLACGCPVLTSNVAYRHLFAAHPLAFIEDEAPAAIAARIATMLAGAGPAYGPEAQRALVVGHHDLGSFIDKLIAQFARLMENR